jgi:hypothetical protein
MKRKVLGRAEKCLHREVPTSLAEATARLGSLTALIEQQRASVDAAIVSAPWKISGRKATYAESQEFVARYPVVIEYIRNIAEARLLQRSWPQKRIAHEFGVCERTIRNAIAGNYNPRIDTPSRTKSKRSRGRPRKWTREKYMELLEGRGTKPKSLRQRLSDARRAMSEKCRD